MEMKFLNDMESQYSPNRVQHVYDDAAAGAMVRKVYLWMAMALAITGLVAYYVASDANLLEAIFTSRGVFMGLMIAELALVIVLSATIDRLSPAVATLMFLAYSVINGVVMSSIFVVYDLGSIATTFFISAGMFGTMALYGTFTHKDLTSLGNMFYMALWGLILALAVNLLLKNSVLDMVISGVGVVLFTGITAYDSQKIKAALQYSDEEDEVSMKVAVLGALALYLDFINIFLYLLRFLGGNRK